MKQIVLLLLLHVLAVSRVKARTHDASLRATLLHAELQMMDTVKQLRVMLQK